MIPGAVDASLAGCEETRFQTIGFVHKGFILVVVWTQREPRQRLISVRPANRKEYRKYEQEP